ISMTGTPASLWKCGTTLSDIVVTLRGDGGGRNQTVAAIRNAAHHTDGYSRLPVQRIFEVAPPHAHLVMQIRHNLVVREKPFFRRGCCVAKAAHYLSAIVDDIWFFGMNGFSG